MISIILNSMLMVANNPCVVFFLDRFWSANTMARVLLSLFVWNVLQSRCPSIRPELFQASEPAKNIGYRLVFNELRTTLSCRKPFNCKPSKIDLGNNGRRARRNVFWWRRYVPYTISLIYRTILIHWYLELLLIRASFGLGKVEFYTQYKHWLASR